MEVAVPWFAFKLLRDVYESWAAAGTTAAAAAAATATAVHLPPRTRT